MFPTDLANPFADNHALKDSLAVPRGHVPELHAPVLGAIRNTIASCRADRSPSSVLVLGEAGSGKTHLLAQLRADLHADPSALVVGLSFFGAYPGALWRHVRKELFAGLLRPPTPAGADGLTRILHARYPKWGTQKAAKGSLFDILLGRDAAPSLATFLAAESEVPDAVRTVLAKLYDPATHASAASWLKGEQLSDEKLAALGLPDASATDRESEAAARDVVLALCHLAGDKMLVVLGFDNIETVQTTLTDEKALRELAWIVGELATGEGTRVVVTFVRPETMVSLRRAADKPAVQRMAAVEAEIPWLGRWEHVVRVVAARFEPSDAWRNLRSQHPEPYWPLGEKFLRDLIADNKFALTPRHLIGACRVEIERLRTGEKFVVLKPVKPPSGGQAPPAPGKAVSFDAPWLKRRDKYVAQPLSLTFDAVIGQGLPWLREAYGAAFDLFEHPVDSLPDVPLLFRPTRGGRMIGVSGCDQAPTLVWRRLDRLSKQWQDRSTREVLESLVLIRQAATKLTPAAEKRFAALEASGVTVLLLPREQYAELAAYQQIFANVQAGNYVDVGRPVAAAEFAAWARGHLSSSVKELADALFGTPAARQPAAKKTAKARV